MDKSKQIYALWESKKKRERGRKLFKEIMVENSPNLGRKLEIQVHEAQKTSYKISSQRRLHQDIIKLLKVKNKENFEGSKRKVTYYI